MDCLFCKIINGEIPSTKVYEDFTLEYDIAGGHIVRQNNGSSGDASSVGTGSLGESSPEPGSFASLPDDDGTAAEMKQKMAESNGDASDNKSGDGSGNSGSSKTNIPVSISVTANGKSLTLTGKDSYVFVDVFDKLNFDLSKSNGRKIITLLNGKNAMYLEPLKGGDVIEIRWEDI
mgnify:CR=1 FL=1